MTIDLGVLHGHVRAAVSRAQKHLLGLQSPHGWWKAEETTNVTMDAEDLLLREFLGIRRQQETVESARWIRSQQNSDGTWTTFGGGPGELSTTIEGYIALRLAGDQTHEPHMRRAAAWVRMHGGVENSRVFTRLWMAMFGLWPWERLPALPPELVMLPRGVPLNIYDWACWARQTIVPLTVVSHFRPVRPLAFGVDELHSPHSGHASRGPQGSQADGFRRLDEVLHLWEEKVPHRWKPLRRHALRRAAEWIIARQEADGSWGGLQPPWVYSIIALRLLGCPLDHPILRSALHGFDGFLIRETTSEGTVRRLEGCQGPVWDTALAVIALADSGLPSDHPSLAAAGQWLLGAEVRSRGDWAVRRPRLPPGGWAFEFANDHYPDIDDAAEVVLALDRLRTADTGFAARVRDAQERAVTWVSGMQSRGPLEPALPRRCAGGRGPGNGALRGHRLGHDEAHARVCRTASIGRPPGRCLARPPRVRTARCLPRPVRGM
ncbi:hypothetical protein ACH4SK_43630 [Streptomyces inhibens]|uniref:hypothetical protein n=1 Tax=Streptomyces inhibens TaxID=2293571 RepID=UPI0037A16734